MRNTDPLNLLLDLEEFYRRNKWHQQGGRSKEGYYCLVVAMGMVQEAKDHSYIAYDLLKDTFLSHKKVKEFTNEDTSSDKTDVRKLILFNDHPSTTWEDVQELFSYTKERLKP